MTNEMRYTVVEVQSEAEFSVFTVADGKTGLFVCHYTLWRDVAKDCADRLNRRIS